MLIHVREERREVVYEGKICKFNIASDTCFSKREKKKKLPVSTFSNNKRVTWMTNTCLYMFRNKGGKLKSE